MTASIVTGQYVNPKAGRISLREYASGWGASQTGSEATAQIVDNSLRLHVLPALGDRPLASIRRSDVQGLVKALSQPQQRAPNTTKAVYNTLSRLMAAAMFDKVIASTPCHRIALPASPRCRGDPADRRAGA